MEQIEAAVLGSSGYTGGELTAVLAAHPNVIDLKTPSTEGLEEFEGSEVVFSTLPNTKSAPWVAKFRNLGSAVIDLSGDFRFSLVKQYEHWYGTEHPAPQLVNEMVPYGLPEINREQLGPDTKLVAVPGCYPTATILTLAPLVKQQLIDPECTIIVNGLSGYSGRGKNADNSDLVDQYGVGHNAKPYKTGRKHQHVGEIDRSLHDYNLLFSPKVLSNKRGLLTEAGVRLALGVTPKTVRETLEKQYSKEPFVSLLPDERLPDMSETTHTDECHIGLVPDVSTGIVIIGGSIDNLRKGAATQAVQVFNLIHGLPEETGLKPKAGWQPTGTQ